MINDNNGSIRIIAFDDNKISLNSIVNNSVVSKGDLQ